MSSGFYITELGKDSFLENKIKPKENGQKDLNEINENFTLSSINEKKDQATLEKTKHNVLDYLIREETNFADLNKVEKYFKNEIILKSKKYDVNQTLIKRKLKDIEEVQDLINREIISNIDLDKDEAYELYNIEKDNLESKIEQISHDNECYEYMLERFYTNNVCFSLFKFFIIQ